MKNLKININKVWVVLFTMFASGQAFAQSTNIGSMFVSFQPSIQALIKLVIAVSMIMGISLIINSIYQFAKLGEGNGQRGDGVKAPIFTFLSGIALFGLMLSLRTIGETIAMGSGPGDFLMPSSSGTSTATQAIILAILWFVRLVGFIALVRGILLFYKYGQGQSNQGELGRALTHLFGGVMAIHIDSTARILAGTFAPGVAFPI